MCGFVAICGPQSGAPLRIERGLSAIRHRGPDGRGVYRSNDGRVAFGHARLRILDLSSEADQPMKSRSGRGVLAYNGEIYNFQELAPRVDVPLRTTSDTEVLLELLQKYGEEAIPLLRGMFAFAYWDGEELLLVRDRLGVKPLFYAERPGELMAASELAGLLAMGAENRPDLGAIDDYLTYLYVPPPRTGIVGVCELPPGHVLRWSAARGARISRYWSPPATQSGSPITGAEIRDLLRDAVRAHMVSDTPIGVFLSGGIDSSSLVALSAEMTPEPLRTFTVTFGNEGSYLDERDIARVVARAYGTKHEEIHVKANAGDILPRLVRHFGQPFGNPTAVLSYALSEATRKHVKVALAGDGGDEVFGGYPRYQGLLLAERTRRLPKEARALARWAARLMPEGRARGLASNRWRRFFSQTDLSPEQAYYRWVSYLDRDRKRSFLASPTPEHDDYAFFDALRKEVPALGDELGPFLDLGSFLPHNVLNYGDRMSMAHALEVRVPFCDHVLVERLARVPLREKLPLFLQKGLLRWAMRDVLPVQVSLHRKVGFNPPIHSWLRHDLRPLMESLLGAESLKTHGLLNASSVLLLRQAFERGDASDAHTLWSLLVLETWLAWLKQAPSELARTSEEPMANVTTIPPKATPRSGDRIRVIVSAPRGSGGAYAHLAQVIPRLVEAHPDWDLTFHAPGDVLETIFGRADQPWAQTLGGADYRARLHWEFVELPALLKKEPHALVYAPLGPPLNLAISPRTVWMSHNIIPLLDPQTWCISEGDRARIFALRNLASTHARIARGVICVSQHARTRLTGLSGVANSRIRVIPHGIVAHPPPPSQHPKVVELLGTPYILNVAPAVPYRKSRELFQAYAELVHAGVHLPKLVVVGTARGADAGYEHDCLSILGPLISKGLAVHLGQLPHRDVLALMASAQTFAYPSVHEDCPNVVLEALAFDRVAVYVDIPAARELVAEGAVYAPTADPAVLAEALLRAVTNDTLRQDVLRRAKPRAALFSWDRTAARTAEALLSGYYGKMNGHAAPPEMRSFDATQTV